MRLRRRRNERSPVTLNLGPLLAQAAAPPAAPTTLGATTTGSTCREGHVTVVISAPAASKYLTGPRGDVQLPGSCMTSPTREHLGALQLKALLNSGPLQEAAILWMVKSRAGELGTDVWVGPDE
jgi:hypothetical protein